MGSRFAGIGSALGTGLGSGLKNALMPQIKMRNQMRTLQRLAPQAQQAAQSLQGLNPTALSLLGIQQPKPNPLDFLSQALAASLSGGQMGGLGGFPQGQQGQQAPQAQQFQQPPQGGQQAPAQDTPGRQILVVHKQTGETGLIPQEKFDPDVFERK